MGEEEVVEDAGKEMTGRTLVLGDVHGAYRALMQVFERAQLDYENDTVLFLGDVCDGRYEDTRQCIDELLKLKHLRFVLGNHDEWLLQWARGGWKPEIWVEQGGAQTLASYGAGKYGWGEHDKMPQDHIAFLESGKDYVMLGNRLFLHGGIPAYKGNYMRSVCGISGDVLRWDRSLWEHARADGQGQLTQYEEVFVGHTTTEHYSKVPVKACEVWNLDQGAGWNGWLSMMDVDTKEAWQSEQVVSLYASLKKGTA